MRTFNVITAPMLLQTLILPSLSYYISLSMRTANWSAVPSIYRIFLGRYSIQNALRNTSHSTCQQDYVSLGKHSKREDLQWYQLY